MNFDDLFPPHEDNTGGTYTTGRSEKEPNKQVGAYIALSLLLTVSIILLGVIGHISEKSNANSNNPPPNTAQVPSASPENSSSRPDCIVDYTWSNTSYSGFLFRFYDDSLPDGYMLTSSEIFSDNSDATQASITVTDSNKKKYNAYFRYKNDTLGIALLLVHGNDLPKGATLCDPHVPFEGNPAQALLSDTALSENDTDSHKAFPELESLPRDAALVLNDAGQVFAAIMPSNKTDTGLEYAITNTELNDWIWDTLINPLRYIGIHGKIISSRDQTEQILNSGFRVDYVEPTKKYDLTDCLAPGDLILGYFDNYSMTRPNDLSDIDALNSLYNNFTDGKLVALSFYRSENKDRIKPIFLRHNIER